jgi:hypothetical protein
MIFWIEPAPEHQFFISQQGNLYQIFLLKFYEILGRKTFSPVGSHNKANLWLFAPCRSKAGSRSIRKSKLEAPFVATPHHWVIINQSPINIPSYVGSAQCFGSAFTADPDLDLSMTKLNIFSQKKTYISGF